MSECYAKVPSGSLGGRKTVLSSWSQCIISRDWSDRHFGGMNALLGSFPKSWVPIYTPQYYKPCYGDPGNDSPNSGKPQLLYNSSEIGMQAQPGRSSRCGRFDVRTTPTTPKPERCTLRGLTVRLTQGNSMRSLISVFYPSRSNPTAKSPHGKQTYLTMSIFWVEQLIISRFSKQPRCNSSKRPQPELTL